MKGKQNQDIKSSSNWAKKLFLDKHVILETSIFCVIEVRHTILAEKNV